MATSSVVSETINIFFRGIYNVPCHVLSKTWSFQKLPVRKFKHLLEIREKLLRFVLFLYFGLSICGWNIKSMCNYVKYVDIHAYVLVRMCTL